MLASFAYFFLTSPVGNAEYSKAMERGEALSRYVEEVMPPQEYPGHIIYCAYYADAQILSIVWEEDLAVYLHLSPEYEEGQSEDCPGEEE